MDQYEINEKTLALIAEKDKTRVYEDNETFIINKTSNEIMEDSCSYFGSSLSGRQKGTAALIGVTHKSPVIVEESRELIFFPTTSPRLSTCSWISLKNLESYYTVDKKVILNFKNHQQLELNLTYGIVDNQVLRATRLESVLRGRKSSKKL